MQKSFDVVIVGAGAMGASAAWALARKGQSVLLLEQFAVGHTRGSSHGGSRIVRYTHAELDYAAIMPEIFDLWRTLEADSGESLMHLCGGIYVAQDGDPFLMEASNALEQLGMTREILDAAELRRRYPQFRLAHDQIALYQAESGILAASHCVGAAVRVALEKGAVLYEYAHFEGVEPVGDAYEVTFSRQGSMAKVRAGRVIVTAGAWAGKVLATLLPAGIGDALPLQVTHQQVAYFRATQPELWQMDRCPIYIFTSAPHVYGFPIYETAGEIKVAQELFDVVVDPDAARAPLAEHVDALSAIVADRFVGVDPEPTEVVTCLYTETPNRDFIIDRHPQHPGIIFAAGFSGRGFKFAAGIGTLLADLATSDAPPADHRLWLPWWALNRFDKDAPAATHSGVEIFGRQ